MKRSVQGNSAKETVSGDGSKRPRGRPSKSDLLKEEVKKNKETGARTLFGFMKTKHDAGDKSSNFESKLSFEESGKTLEKHLLTDTLSTTFTVGEQSEKLDEVPCQDSFEASEGNDTIGEKPNFEGTAVERTPEGKLNYFEEKDFIELKLINQRTAHELADSKTTIDQMQSQIEQLKGYLQKLQEETSLSRDKMDVKVASLESEVQDQRNDIKLKTEVINNFKEDISKYKAEADFYKKQPVHVHELITVEEKKVLETNPLRKGLLHSFIMNTTRSSSLYTNEERDFWIDRYNHSTVSEFDNLSSNLNGPRRSTVQKWIGPRQAVDFGLSAERILGAANFYNGKQETMSQTENDLVNFRPGESRKFAMGQ